MPVKDNLARIVGEKDISDDAGKLAAYAGDMSFNKPVRPNYLVQPENPQEIQEFLNRAHNHRTQRPRSRLESLFVNPYVTVKVSFKKLIKSRTFGMSWTVLRRGFRSTFATPIRGRPKVCFGSIRTKGDRLKPEEHGGQ